MQKNPWWFIGWYFFSLSRQQFTHVFVNEVNGILIEKCFIVTRETSNHQDHFIKYVKNVENLSEEISIKMENDFKHLINMSFEEKDRLDAALYKKG